MSGDVLFVLLKNERMQLLIYISKIRFPNHYCCAFPLYMLVQYYRIKQQERFYSLKQTDTSFIHELASKLEQNIIDDNYSVLIKNVYMKDKDYAVLTANYSGKLIHRYVKLVPNDIVAKGTVEVSSPLMFNIINELEIKRCTTEFEDLMVQIKCIPTGKIVFADEIELALVSSPSDIDNTTIDTIIKYYFEDPKLIHESDIIEINVKKYSMGLVRNITKIINYSENVHFKCTKLLSKNERTRSIHGYYVVIGETTVTQSANIQSYIPSHIGIRPKLKYMCDAQHGKRKYGTPLCPYGLESYAAHIEEAVKPFLIRSFRLRPAFLITGKKGSGKEILIASIAAKFGMHFYKVTNFDVTALVYAQNEVKLNNIFFNAKLYAPCIIYMKNFENFEKNNEGQSDERIITHFTDGLKNLFENNKYPVILFCSCNEDDISGRLKREFLEIFKINPLTEKERAKNLEWLLEKHNFSYKDDIQELARKTSSFLFEDLKTLVQKAFSFHSSEFEHNILDHKSFVSAIDCMQRQYSESIGAPKVPSTQWDDIGGLTEVKEEIIKTINFPLKHPQLFASTGLKRFGIMLFGPPGTGKTLLAKAVATECNLCFLSVKGPELLNMYVGQSEKNIREVFERARAASPCIIFFDELDSLAPNRGVSGDSGGVMGRVVSQLLAEMDGINEKATVFVIGATNRPDLIDPALLRPGRFDKLLYVGPSVDFNSRLSVLKALTRKFHLAADVDLKEVIKICPENISGADFYGICAKSWTSAVRRIIEESENDAKDISHLRGNDVMVNFSDFQNAIRSVKPSITPDDLKYFEKLKRDLCSNK